MSNPFNNVPEPVTLTVSQLNRQARSLLESHFDFVWVEGEISNFAAPSSGHWYFSLKDGNAQVRCAMFRGRNQRLRFRPENGDHIRLRCRVSLYEGRGEFQLIAEHMELAGAGALQAAFEKLKAKLLAEGLFDADRKQPLPESVSHLGVITSPTGAAIHDILTVLERRCPAIEVSILPVAVQGDSAAPEIVAAIERANRLHEAGDVQLDALIVGRGGGSLEDLWAFNEEIVARAIAASKLPIVSAVGHEVDFSIADMVADQRAPTPSAAAEMLSPDQREQMARLKKLEADLVRLMRRKLADAQTRLDHLRARLKHPGAQLREQSQRLDDLEQRLILAQKNLLARKKNELALLESRLHANSPLPRIQQMQKDLTVSQQRLEGAMQTKLADARNRLAHLAQMLDSLSPLATLARGYAIVTDADGKVVTDASSVAKGTSLTTRLASGSLEVTVDSVSEKDS
ncbi:exodeoxyribonuclease VII large subunit [Halioglobus japonicus]|uniref:exodeoxyribonuclease VII large subunit n=1 Tax=Halioglobus japonicus TaxID=930805 RepID=UPI0009796A05|nr:exodeoxyribonuclease VII large subunit [Halioglobus japonicus]AQA19698.1 exodeoxyribonuclease VII large subunit [Halioglobus japonicus]GHD09512.1 exodeoxyribonuclease 7 large subunit [Halioglobus japonicus]